MTEVKTDNPKLFVQTHGCQMNVYDSSKMADVLHQSHHMELTKNIEEADVILLNTCSVREKPQDKVFSDLGRFNRLKKKRPHVMIGVGGCVASQEGHAIIKRAPYVNLVFGPQTLHRLPEMLEQAKETHKPVVDTSFPEIEKFDKLPEPRAEGATAFVSIMEGCSKYCTFCIVPYTRGEEISRPFDDVLAEVSSLADQGVREINLLGQNVNDYQGKMYDGNLADLALLMHYIAAIDGIDRIRFTTSHPQAFTDNLIEAYAEIPELANHLHLPVQSGSNRILQMMKRNYTVEHYKELIAKLREVRPDISISSDFIIGFPGETTADFEATMNLIHDIQFDTSFSFIYSPRPGTPAAKLHDNVSMEEKKQRLNILQTRILQQAKTISQKMIGTLQKVLITGHAKKSTDQISGRTENNRIVNCQGSHEHIGKFIDVRITEALTNSMRGQISEG
jgi:tRNA-2-methylthio-N6-dimethylallyladenosine synthase